LILTWYIEYLYPETPETTTVLSQLGLPELIHKQYYLSSSYLTDQTITLTESPMIVGSGTTGLRTWQASLMFAAYLLTHPEVIQHQRVLELGSGVGFLGRVMQQLNPAHLTVSDYHPQVLMTLVANMVLNTNLANLPTTAVECLDWNQVPEIQYHRINANVIIGADVTYDPECIRSLVALLHQFIINPPTVPTTLPRSPCHAYLAYTVRNPETFTFFLTTLDKTMPRLQYTIQPLHSPKLPTPTVPLFYYEDTMSTVILVHIFS